LLSEFECGELRKEYEAQQVELQKQKGFGGAYSDLGFDQSAGLQQIWENLRPRALSAIAAAYPKAVESVADLVVLSSQLIKYNRSAGVAEAKNEHGSYSPVRQHVDPSWISLNIAFNSRSEYNGGGVWFPSLGLDATMIDEGSAVVHPGFVNHQSAPLKKGVRYGLQVWVNVSSYTQFHRTAYADGEEASFRRSATRAVMEGWDASTTFELQYRLAMSLVGQLSFSKGTLHGLDKYVECKRLHMRMQVLSGGSPNLMSCLLSSQACRSMQLIRPLWSLSGSLNIQMLKMLRVNWGTLHGGNCCKSLCKQVIKWSKH